VNTTRIEQRDGLWSLYTKDLPQSTLRTALLPAPEHVVVEAFRPIPSIVWTDLTVQLQPSLPPEVLSIRDLRLDLRMSKDEFIHLASLWRVGGVQAWFLGRRCPDTLRILELPDSKRFQILAPLGFALEFTWPLPAVSDWACFVSADNKLIQGIATALSAAP
jgi:hypothetical protein